MFLHLSVFLSTGDLWADTPPRTDTLQADTPLYSACWDMVNNWAVRILLECNLVQNTNADIDAKCEWTFKLLTVTQSQTSSVNRPQAIIQ